MKKDAGGYYMDTATGKVRISREGNGWVAIYMKNGHILMEKDFKRRKDVEVWVNEGWRNL